MAFFLLPMAGFKQQTFGTEGNSFTSVLVHYAKLQYTQASRVCCKKEFKIVLFILLMSPYL
jgi:hypothetical protein